MLAHKAPGAHISLAHLKDGVGERDQQMSSPQQADACSQAVIPSKELLGAEGGAQGAFDMGKKKRENVKHTHARPHAPSSAYGGSTAIIPSSLNLQ